MQKTILPISITLRGPLLTQSSSPGKIGYDTIVARNHKKQAYLPGSLISGKIRQSLEELDNALTNADKPDWFAPQLDDWLGKESKDTFAINKRLYFSDFVLEKALPYSSTRYRIKIDAERGSVENNQLVMLENPFLSGDHYTFTGEIHFFSSQRLAEDIKQHINIAIKWLSTLGALSSVGFGQVKNAETKNCKALTIPKPEKESSNATDKLAFCLQSKYAFCLVGKPNADNLFASESIIPGSAIKACIANTWNHFQDKQNGIMVEGNAAFNELQKSLSQIRISHAFPGHKNNKRPVVAPLSIVTTIEGKGENKKVLFHDVAQLSTASLINNKAPSFSVDWKDTDNTLTAYPWPYIRFKDWGWEDKLTTELRVHTKIDRNSNRSAEGELFAYEQTVAEDKNWYGEFDFSNVKTENKAKAIEQLKALCTLGLIGLGKTKTPFSLNFPDKIEADVSNTLSPMTNNCWLITLQTDTLLGSPEYINKFTGKTEILNESSGKAELERMYQQAWDEISNGSLTLLRYFARQHLSGGRFRQNTLQTNHQHYRPWLLTEAGSIFILQEKTEESVKPLINKWLAQGLPFTQSAIHWYKLGDDPQNYWQHIPFVPENGYGEIAVNIKKDGIEILQDHDVEAIKHIDCTQNGENP